MTLFYDIEAFPQYWCVVVVDDETETRHVFEDVNSLRDFYKTHMEHTWVGYNSRQYDSPMLRFIMLGLDPFECSQDLIVLGKKWFQFPYNVVEKYKRIPLKNFDCILLNKGLKKLEAFRGSSVIECDIPWDYPDVLTREQKDDVIKYCTHDVLECRKVFYDTYEEYEAHESLVSAFNLHSQHFNKTKAQLGALILGAEKQSWYDEWQFQIPDTIQLDKYQYVLDWYRDLENHDYDKKLHTDIAGVPHDFAWGGVHGARPKYSGTGVFINMDVASFYPALMIEYGYLSRNVKDPDKYRQMRDQRIVFKKEKDPRQLPYKIVLNGTYGAMKDKYNNLYDPRQANSVCIGGQLLLLDLIEKLEPVCEIIQSNTDGVLIKLQDPKDYDTIVAIGQEWSDRTKMILEYDTLVKVYQKDVNNYLTIDEKGKVKSKGAWAKTWLKERKINGEKKLVDDYTDYDLVILREALKNYFVDGTPVEDTILNCKDLIKFQKVVMVSRKYKCGFHGTCTVKKSSDPNDYVGEILVEKHLRVFASTNAEHGGIFKIHAVTGRMAKANDTPVNAFLVNGNIEGVNTDDYPLDKQYYIDMAKKRLKGFGVQ